MYTVEVITPVRPHDRDRYPVQYGSDPVKLRTIVCPDGNLSVVYRDAYLASNADIVIFKHDDFFIRDWHWLYRQIILVMELGYPIVGVAGTRAYAPERSPAWWMQAGQRVGMVDGLNRGLVHHRQDGKWLPTIFGSPGDAVVLDGCFIAVARSYGLLVDYHQQLHPERMAEFFDLSFRNHFYDIAFTLRASRWGRMMGVKRPPCFVVMSDVLHESPGELAPMWHQAAERFVANYRDGQPISVEDFRNNPTT